MKNMLSKMILNNWNNAKNEHAYAKSYSSACMSENDWNNNFFFSGSGTPGVTSDQNLIENVNWSQIKSGCEFSLYGLK